MVSVIAVPVTLKPVESHLRVHVLGRPNGNSDNGRSVGGKWYSHSLLGAGHGIVPTAQILLAQACPQLTPDALRQIPLENAGVFYGDGAPNLVVTAVLPMQSDDAAASELLVPWQPDAASSTPNNPEELAEPDPVQRIVIEYWRQQLAHTNAVFDFLPKYFTSAQIRAVYSSLWGRKQSDGNFARWLKGVRGPDGQLIRADLVKDPKKARELVRHEVRDEFARRVAATGTIGAEAIIRAWPDGDKAPVGISAAVNPLPELTVALHPGFAAIGAQVGATLAYQDGKKGSPPNWHTRAHPGRVLIDAPYSVHPAQDFPRNTFIA